MSEMRRVHVARKSVEAMLAQGYTFAKPDGRNLTADGKLWVGDAVVMEIPEKVYQAMQEERLRGFRAVSERIRKGQCPVPTHDLGEGVVGLYESEEVRDASAPRRG